MKLHEELLELRKREKEIGASIISKLQIMESGRKYLRLGYSSLFDYLVRGLGYSESAAYQKQSCVRLTKEIPEIEDKINSGKLTQSGLSMAFKVLKTKSLSEKKDFLTGIENKPNREIKKILAQEEKAPEIKIHRTEYEDKVVLRLELSKEQNEKLERLRALKSHQGDTAELLEKMMDRELKEFEKNNFRKSKSRNIRFVSKTLRNSVFNRAGYRCQRPGCDSTHFLQVDHIVPVRAGGRSEPKNLQLLCSAHNRMKG